MGHSTRWLTVCVAVAGTLALGASAAVAEPADPGNRSRDFTLNGSEDLLARQNDGSLLVYPHSGEFQGSDTYQPAEPIAFEWNRYNWLGAADVTGDGNPDAIGRDPKSSELLAFPHSGNWDGENTLEPEPVSFGFGWNGLDRLVFQDFSGDGIADIAGRPAGSGELRLYVNDGSGGLEAPVPFADGFPNSTWIDAADLTGDGDPELVARGPNGVLWALTGGEEPEQVVLGYGWNTLNALTMKDVDGGGVESMAGRVAGSNKLVVYRYQGKLDGLNTFGPREPLGAGSWHTVNVII